MTDLNTLVTLSKTAVDVVKSSGIEDEYVQDATKALETSIIKAEKYLSMFTPQKLKALKDLIDTITAKAAKQPSRL